MHAMNASDKAMHVLLKDVHTGKGKQYRNDVIETIGNEGLHQFFVDGFTDGFYLRPNLQLFINMFDVSSYRIKADE
jgi:hypothetical protein